MVLACGKYKKKKKAKQYSPRPGPHTPMLPFLFYSHGRTFLCTVLNCHYLTLYGCSLYLHSSFLEGLWLIKDGHKSSDSPAIEIKLPFSTPLNLGWQINRVGQKWSCTNARAAWKHDESSLCLTRTSLTNESSESHKRPCGNVQSFHGKTQSSHMHGLP